MIQGLIVRSRILAKAPRIIAKDRTDGFLSSEYPDFITTVEGVPASCELRVLLRRQSRQFGDGKVVAITTSAPDGTWIVTGLNPELRYDVVCRHADYNDMILSNVQPVIA
ncbi:MULTISPECIES: hypothetical protein [Acinetobacter]|uniref:Uncharacterized protein n=1 Tax=Acinetobacter higginsii TaxID=70347 RepID=N9RI70_9GAMM|nr:MULTISPECIES: hypothetical protein [Acinetobacter]ENX57654.1 hypothetical protein F902_02051 [Acinetobacter higginsii]